MLTSELLADSKIIEAKNRVMKIALIGNCQLTQLGSLLKLDFPKFEFIQISVDSQMDNCDILKELDRSDIIVARLYSHNANQPSLVESELRRTHGNKTIFIPTLYFRGYHPGFYYWADLHVLESPYVSIVSIHDYANDTDAATAARNLESGSVLARHGLIKSTEDWLQKARDLSQASGIDITSRIEARVSEAQLFYTPNHPNLSTISLIRDEIINMIVPSKKTKSTPYLNDPALDSVVLPVLPVISDYLKLKYDPPKQLIVRGRVVADSSEEIVLSTFGVLREREAATMALLESLGVKPSPRERLMLLRYPLGGGQQTGEFRVRSARRPEEPKQTRRSPDIVQFQFSTHSSSIMVPIGLRLRAHLYAGNKLLCWDYYNFFINCNFLPRDSLCVFEVNFEYSEVTLDNRSGIHLRFGVVNEDVSWIVQEFYDLTNGQYNVGDVLIVEDDDPENMSCPPKR